MTKTIKPLLLLIILLFTGVAYAYDEPQYNSNFLLSVLFKAQELRDKATMEIRKIDMEIKKNEEAIQKSEKIISLAQQKGNTKAEMVAKDALMKAQEAKRKNEETKKQWELNKMRADRSYAAIQNMFSQNLGSSKQIKGFMSNYTGNVYIIKANGEKASPDNGFLDPGDKVWTGNGSAEIQMLDGRGSATLGPYSEFVMKKDTPQEQVVELLKGKVYMAVDKIDEYAKKMNEKIDQYKEDLQTIKQLNKEDIKDIENYLRNENRILRNIIRHVEEKVNKTPITVVVGVRGTKFTSEIKDNNTYEVTVLEGIVDVTILEKDKTLSVEAGNKAIIGVDGDVKVEKIDQIEKWWEE